MSDAMQTPAETAQTSSDTDAEASENGFTLENVKRRYFSPDQLGEAEVFVNQVLSLEGLKVHRNFDVEKQFPTDFGLGVIPISAREGNKNVVKSVAICAIPDIRLVTAHEKGQAFLTEIVTDAFLTKAANAFRERSDGSVPASVPESVDDFISSMRSRESLKTFNEIAPAFVTALKKKGIKFMTTVLLRQTLSSAAFAASQFEKIGQESWEAIIDAMVANATGKGLDPSILNHWKNTRNEKTATVELDDDVIGAALDEIA